MPWLHPTLSFLFALASALSLCALWARWQRRPLPPEDTVRLVGEEGRFVESGLIAPAYVALAPLAGRLAVRGVAPSLLTAGSLCAAALIAGALLQGWWVWALWLLLLHACFDTLDGAVARRADRATARGAMLDRGVDILSEAIVLGALAWVTIQDPLLLAVGGLLIAAWLANLGLWQQGLPCKVPVLARRGWRLGAVAVILGVQIIVEGLAPLTQLPTGWPLPTGLMVLAFGSTWGRYRWGRRLAERRGQDTLQPNAVTTNTSVQDYPQLP
ncbi:MAG: CDP-alcohol phosphatidyltransferase family protein [Opitutales bacterium]